MTINATSYLYDDKTWSDLTAELLRGWTWNTAECEGVCGNGTQPTRGSAGQSFFKAGGDDNCFHTALLEEFSPKFGDISDRKPALDPRFVLLGRILQFPSKPPSSPMVGPMPDER